MLLLISSCLEHLITTTRLMPRLGRARSVAPKSGEIFWIGFSFAQPRDAVMSVAQIELNAKPIGDLPT
jgi:hypothetical protein